MILPRAHISCDIFCRVVDNFGDIGVAWRLARQLACEHGLTVRLFVDDLNSFNRIEPSINTLRPRQSVQNVTVMYWDQALAAAPADLVIESFAVNLPTAYIAAMGVRALPPVWVNLEYLSAESWVATHHLLPSPHPGLPLIKYFFFPGFARDTGGVIRERNLMKTRDAASSTAQAGKLRVFIFAYRNAAAANLLKAMSESTAPQLRCTLTEGAEATNLKLRDLSQIYDMKIDIIPFTAQTDFDRLLWQHEVLFVRGEDSFVRAQWAGKPFVWHIYPQDENAHWLKLEAFLGLYCNGLQSDAAEALCDLMRVWNAEDEVNIGSAWRRFVVQLPAIQIHAKAWSQKLAQMPDLAANLLSFYQKTTKI